MNLRRKIISSFSEIPENHVTQFNTHSLLKEFSRREIYGFPLNIIMCMYMYLYLYMYVYVFIYISPNPALNWGNTSSVYMLKSQGYLLSPLQINIIVKVAEALWVEKRKKLQLEWRGLLLLILFHRIFVCLHTSLLLPNIYLCIFFFHLFSLFLCHCVHIYCDFRYIWNYFYHWLSYPSSHTVFIFLSFFQNLYILIFITCP